MFTQSPPIGGGAGGAGGASAGASAGAVILQREENRRYEDKTLEDLKSLLKKLLSNNIDQFEVIVQARRLAIGVEEGSFSRQKYLLQKRVLEQILIKEETHYYVRLLEETNRNLIIKSAASKYHCCLIGCLFTGDKHWKYLSHLKQVHPTYEQLACNFLLKCKRRFSSFAALHEHVKNCHSKVKPTSVREVQIKDLQTVDCKCDMVSCSGTSFTSIDKLLSHITNFHAHESRQRHSQIHALDHSSVYVSPLI